MTGSTAGVLNLILREPPHLPFLQGWPGIPASDTRPPATVQGTLEVRSSNSQPIKTKWLRIEIRKYEGPPNGSSKALQTNWGNVGRTHVLWQAPDGKDWEPLNTTDFRFVIPLPLDTPPTCDLGKNGGIRYELLASACYKGKGGFFRKDASVTISASQPIRIVKYDLASAWPIYNQPEERSSTSPDGGLMFVVTCSRQAYGPGDRVVVSCALKSQMPQAFRVKSIELALTEVTTIMPQPSDGKTTLKKKSKNAALPTTKRSQVTSARTIVGEFVGPGTETRGMVDLLVPTDDALLTIRAKSFHIEYELRVEAVLESSHGSIAVSGIPCVIGTFSKSSAQQAVK
jgi:hypothetical protein